MGSNHKILSVKEAEENLIQREERRTGKGEGDVKMEAGIGGKSQDKECWKSHHSWKSQQTTLL